MSEEEIQLNIEELDVVYSALFPARNKYHNLGLALGLDEPKLVDIESNSPDNETRLRKTLSHWLQSSTSPTWTDICTALRRTTVQLDALAANIEKSNRNTVNGSERRPHRKIVTRKRVSGSSNKFRWCIVTTAVLALLATITGTVYLIISHSTDTALSQGMDPNNACTSLDPYKVFSQQTLPEINSAFFGRAKELEKLKQLVLADSVHLININGPPAFGKSRLAIHLGHKIEQSGGTIKYINTKTSEKSVFFCSFDEQQKKPISNTTAIGAAADCPNENVYANDLCTWMALQKQRAVIIFDDCDPILHSEDRERFLAMVEGLLSWKLYDIIVVSQEQLMLVDQDDFHSITLGALSVEESQTLLVHYVPKITVEQANEISTVVGGCPLALKLVAQLLKHGKRGGLDNLELILADLKVNLTIQVSKVASRSEKQLHRVIDIAYKNYLNEENRRCSRVLSLFPGPVSEKMAKSVISPIIDPFCIEDIVSLSFVDEYSTAKVRMFSFHKVISDYLNSVNRVHSDTKNFKLSYLRYYSQYLMYIMEQNYVNKIFQYKGKHVLSEEYHNVCEFVRLLLSTKLDEKLTVQTGTALGYLINEELIPDVYEIEVFHKAYDFLINSKVFNSLCAYSTKTICLDILTKSLVTKYNTSHYSYFGWFTRYECSSFNYEHVGLRELLKENLGIAYCFLRHSPMNISIFAVNWIAIFYNWLSTIIWQILSFIFVLLRYYDGLWHSQCVRLMDITFSFEWTRVSYSNTTEAPVCEIKLMNLLVDSAVFTDTDYFATFTLCEEFATHYISFLMFFALILFCIFDKELLIIDDSLIINVLVYILTFLILDFINIVFNCVFLTSFWAIYLALCVIIIAFYGVYDNLGKVYLAVRRFHKSTKIQLTTSELGTLFALLPICISVVDICTTNIIYGYSWYIMRTFYTYCFLSIVNIFYTAPQQTDVLIIDEPTQAMI